MQTPVLGEPRIPGVWSWVGTALPWDLWIHEDRGRGLIGLAVRGPRRVQPKVCLQASSCTGTASAGKIKQRLREKTMTVK